MTTTHSVVFHNAICAAIYVSLFWTQQTLDVQQPGQQSAPQQPVLPQSTTQRPTPQPSTPPQSAPPSSTTPPAPPAAPPAAPSAWSASTPSTMAVERGPAIPVAITATKPLHGLRVVYSTLQDPTSQAIIPPDSLGVGQTIECKSDGEYAPADPKPVLLCVHATRAGSYVGTVVLGARNEGEARPLNLTVHVSSRRYRLLGGVAVFLGIAVSWIVTVLLKRLSARYSALLPAALLRDKVEDLARRITVAQDVLKDKSVTLSFDQVISDLREALSKSNLIKQGYVPGAIASATAGTVVVGDGYPQFLQEKGSRIAVLTILVRGLEQIAKAESHSIDKRVAAAKSIDTQAGDASLTPEQAATAVADAVASMQGAPLAAPSTLSARSSMPTTQEILMHQQVLNASTWLVWAILTLIAGYAALVLTNPGFGTSTDLVKCFLWGLGVQVAGTQLQQLAPSTISSTINVPIQRA